MVHSEKNGFEVSKLLVQHFIQNNILEQAKVAEKHYIVQCLKELKLYTK